MLRILGAPTAIARAQSALRARLEDESDAPVLRKVRWRGGGDELPTHWHPEGRFWVAFVQKPNRFWNAFGLQRPTETPGGLTLTVEVNPPRLGLDRGIGPAESQIAAKNALVLYSVITIEQRLVCTLPTGFLTHQERNW